MTQRCKKTSTLGTPTTGNIRRKIRKRQSQRHEGVQSKWISGWTVREAWGCKYVQLVSTGMF